MHRRDQKRLYKLIFVILARNPFEYGIVPQEGGWVRLKDLHWALMQGDSFRSLSVRGLQQFFELYRPEKMEQKEKLVRVLPEFQAPAFLEFPKVLPPALLYLPVRPRAHAHVLRRGMRPSGNMGWIVLWDDRDRAVRAGKRRDREPLLAVLKTDAALKQGAVFYKAGGEIYLTQWLEPAWLELPPLPESEEKPPAKAGKVGEYGVSPGAAGKSRKKQPGSFMPESPPSWYYNDRNEKTSRRKRKGGKREKTRR